MNEYISIVFVHEELKKIVAQRLKFVPRVGDIIDVITLPMPVVSKVVVSPQQNRLDDLRKVSGHYIPHIVDVVVFLE